MSPAMSIAVPADRARISPLGKVGAGFPSQQTQSVCAEITLKRKIERDDDS